MQVLFIKAMFSTKNKSFLRFQIGTHSLCLIIMKIHVNNGKKMKDQESGCLVQSEAALRLWVQAQSLL